MRLRAALLVPILFFAARLSAGESAGPVSFSKAPQIAKDGAHWSVTFAVSKPCDVLVAVQDAKGNVVRHLAAGVLGKNAPPPFEKDALAQKLAWDGKDDLGAAAQGGPFKIRVAAGLKPTFDKIVGWNPKTFSPISGLSVGPGGEVFVLLSDGFWGRSEVRVLDRDGKYLRTIMPYPANTPPERTESIGHFIAEDGERVPMVFSGHNHTLHPLTAGMRKQSIAFHPKGYLVLAGAVGTMAEHGPPRHLLALDKRGGAPEGLPFVGPEFIPPRGFMGGAGEGPAYCFDHLAASPDGEWIYFATFKEMDEKTDKRTVVPEHHAVFRVKASDANLGKAFLGVDKEAGSDDAHLNNPMGLACGADGSIYVCDQGNGRVMIYAKDGKLRGKFAVPSPQEIAVHPKSGQIYVLSRKTRKHEEPATLLKFAAYKDGETPKELARLNAPGTDQMALDGEASPPKLWTVIDKKKLLAPVIDEGAAFKVLPQVNDNDVGMEFPMFVAADPERNRVLFRERPAGLFSVDLETNKITQLNVKGYDIALDRAGNLYVMDGYGKNSLSRYTPEGKPLPFEGGTSNKISFVYRGYGPNIGLRGHCVAPNGDIYVIASTNYGPAATIGSRVHVFGPDGKMKKDSLVNGLGYGDCGLGVDARGNVYVGANVKPKATPYPAPFAGKVPVDRWIWWKKAQREKPWHYMYYNTYLFHVGSVFKFPPAGGAFYGQDITAREEKRTQAVIDAKNAPEGSAEYTSAYLGREVKVAGAEWSWFGVSNIPSSSDGPSPDPGCVCFNSHLSCDPYGRVFGVHVFGATVQVLDPAGNPITRIGRYGNADSAGPGSTVPEPAIALACPGYASYAKEKLYISDSINRRVVVVRFEYDAEQQLDAK